MKHVFIIFRSNERPVSSKLHKVQFSLLEQVSAISTKFLIVQYVLYSTKFEACNRLPKKVVSQDKSLCPLASIM